MNAPSIDIKDMLEADVTVNTAAFPISRGSTPAEEVDCTIITDFAGSSPELTMDKQKYEYPSVQVKVQAYDYDEGWNHANSIVDSLHGRAHETWNGAYYSVITCLNGPGFYERIRQRSIFIINFNIQRR